MLTPKRKDSYNIWHYGIAGKIGHGDNTDINFLQTSLKMKDLENIKLLVEIPGSEQWGIKDLFQRNVDRERIVGKDGLKNYFTDNNQVKYFNPITLVLLPTNQNEIQHDLPKLNFIENIEFDGLPGQKYTNTDHYRLFVQNIESGNLGKIEWNSEKCYVVAVDGQHRLTALKELYNARNLNNKAKDVETWQIPVVFLIADKRIPTGESKDMIQIIRKIFMYINMKAEKVNDARSILLNDESIECICVQEIISAFHENTFSNNPKETYPPLYMIDWLGTKDTTVIKDTHYLLSNIELRNWVKEYLIGEDFKPYERKTDNLQIQRLELQDMNLDFLNDNNLLSQSDGEQIRQKFNDTIRQPFLKFITNLSSIKKYIAECKKYEMKNSSEDAQLIAFSQLSYGHTEKEVSIKDEVETFAKAFKDQFISFKQDNLSEFFTQDICLRGFVFAYSEIFDRYKEYINKSLDWNEYTDLFLPGFNDLIDSGWCESWGSLKIDKRDKLTHICHSDAGNRINYKIQDIKNAWGIFVVMHVLYFAVKNNIIENQYKDDVWYEFRDRLKSTLQKGFRDIAKREAGQQEMTDDQRKRFINDEKERMANERLKELEEMWGMSADA
jgi:hypothetical protein